MTYAEGSAALSPDHHRHGYGHDHGHDHGDGHDHDHASEHDVATRTNEEEALPEGGVEHVQPVDADSQIRTHLAKYVRDAVASGRQIDGFAKVVGEAEWDAAGMAHYGPRWAPPDGRRNRINAFVDGNRRVWVHKDRGNSGTMVHEAIHKYSAEPLIKESQPLNEGVTEYFTRKVLAKTQPGLSRRNYQSNYLTVDKLVTWISEPTVAAAYFDGAVTSAKVKFNTMGRAKVVENDGDTQGARMAGIANTAADLVRVGLGMDTQWDTFCELCSDQDWAKANAMLSL